MTRQVIVLAAAGLLAAAGVSAQAQNSNAPGIQMQEKGSVKGTTGASGYAPGHTTGAGVHNDTDVKAGGAKVKSNTDIDAGAKVK